MDRLYRKKRLCNDQEASFHRSFGEGWVETLRGQNLPGMTRGWGLNPQAACAKRPWDSLQHDQHWRSFCVWVWHLPQQTAKLVVPIFLSTAVPVWATWYISSVHLLDVCRSDVGACATVATSVLAVCYHTHLKNTSLKNTVFLERPKLPWSHVYIYIIRREWDAVEALFLRYYYYFLNIYIYILYFQRFLRNNITLNNPLQYIKNS